MANFRRWSDLFFAEKVLITGGSIFSMYCTGALIRKYVVAPNWSEGPSMFPTMSSELSMTIGSQSSRHGRYIKVGDIVMVRAPHFQDRMIGKRVIGMPGDYVLRDQDLAPTAGGAHVPGVTDGNEEREEPVMIQVPEGHIWLAGDNMAYSRDSRFYGPVPMALILNKQMYDGDNMFSWKSYRGDQLTKVDDVG